MIEQFKTDSADLITQAKTQLQERLNDGKIALNARRQNFEHNRNQIRDQIQDYRDSVENAD